MPANTYGRQVVEALANKSGGGVIAGDVVVVDTTNNDAFTTSTAGAFTGLVGVAQETIASNATGRILTAGYAALVNTSASVTRGNFGKTHTVAKQAVDAGSSRVAGTFCQFLTGGTTPDAHLFGLADNTSGAGTGTLTTVKDEGSNLSTAVASLDFVGAGVTASGTTAVTATIPGPWTKVIDESGASFTNWTNDVGVWSSNGTEFAVNAAAGVTANARYTPALLTLPCRVDLEVFMDSTGTSQAGGSMFGVKYGASGSGGLLGGLKYVSNNPASNGQGYIELSAITSWVGPTSTFAMDTWIPVSVQFSGGVISIFKSGVLIYVAQVNVTAGATMGSISLMVYENKVKVRNVKAYQLVAP